MTRSPNAGRASFVRTVAPFVGRTEELAWLERCLAETGRGEPRIALVSGEPGIGKTRLLKELRAIALRSGVRVLSGRAREEPPLPYLPFVEALRPAGEELERALGADGAVVRRFLHGAGAERSASVPESPREGPDKVHLFLAVTRAFALLAESGTVLCLLDDLHWADRSTVDLFSHVAFALCDWTGEKALPVFIVAAHRSVGAGEALGCAVARIRREEIAGAVDLAGLDDDQIGELVRGLGIRRPAHQLVSTLAAATRGNPLFVEELLHHFRKEGAIVEKGGAFVTTASADDPGFPEEVTVAIADRIRALTEESRTVLSVASLVGEPFPVDVLRALTGLDEKRLEDAFEEGIRAGVLVSEEGGSQFAHPLVRHVFYSEIAPARRRRLHRDAVAALERVLGDRIEDRLLEIAHHLAAAGPAVDAAKTVDYARRAGDFAFGLFTWAEAANDYELALGAGAALTARERGDLHHRAAVARFRDMDAGPSIEHFEEAASAYREAGDLAGAGEALMGRARALFTLAPVPYGTLIDVEPLGRIVDALGDAEPAFRARALATMSEVHWHARRTEEAKALARRAADVAAGLGDDRLAAETAHVLAQAETQSLEVREALANWRTALEHARRAGDLWLEGWPLQRIPMALAWLGELEEAKAAASEARRLTSKTQDWGDYSMALAALVSVAVLEGRFDEAERRTDETLAMLRRSGYPWGAALALPAVASARAFRGDFTGATRAIDALVRPGEVFADAGPPIQFLAWIHRQLVRASAGEVAEVRAEVGGGLAAATGQGGSDVYALPAYAALVEIADLISAPELARDLHAPLALAFDRGVIFTSGWTFLIPRVLGIADALAGRFDDAEAHFRAAIEAARARGARPELARTCLDSARMRLARGAEGDRERAAELVRAAMPIFRSLGMDPFVRRAAGVADALGLTLPAERETRSGKEDAVSSVRGPRAGLRAAAAPDGTVTILFTDMEGFTPMTERLGDRRAQEIVRAHHAIVREEIRARSGFEVRTQGDGFMVAFSSAREALQCAVAIQRAFAAYSAEHEKEPIRIRIGLNVGDTIREADDFYGRSVIVAARIAALARRGEILVSSLVKDLSESAREFTFDGGREVELKGLAGKHRIYAVAW